MHRVNTIMRCMKCRFRVTRRFFELTKSHLRNPKESYPYYVMLWSVVSIMLCQMSFDLSTMLNKWFLCTIIEMLWTEFHHFRHPFKLQYRGCICWSGTDTALIFGISVTCLLIKFFWKNSKFYSYMKLCD